MPFNIPHLQQLIAKSETGGAIDILVKNSPHIRSKQLRSEALQLAARWNSYQSTHRKGTQDHQTLGIEQRQINNALLGLLSAVEEEQQGDSPFPPPKKNNWKRYAAVAAAIIAVLAGIAEITGVSLSDFWKNGPPKTETNDKPQEEKATAEETTATDKKPDRTATPPSKSKPGPKGTTPVETIHELSLQIETKTNKTTNPATFTSGETMRAYYKVNKPCLLRVIYKLADGRLILFENDRLVTKEQIGQFIELGDGYEAAEPFGDESLYFFVQTDPFPKLKTKMSDDGYLEITDGLQESLRKTRGMKPKKYLAESKLDIETKQ